MVTVFSAIVVISIVIFFHELGHFAIAKLSGVGVEKFSIGFPPKMVSQKIGETEYSIGWIPFGGYVKLVGETGVGDVVDSRKNFMKRSPITRIAILFAGPLMNIVLGMVLIFAILAIGGEYVTREDSPRIGSIAPGMPAQKAGIIAGDLVIYMDGDTIESWTQLSHAIHAKPGKRIHMTLLRNDTLIEIDVVTQLKSTKVEMDDTVLGLIGILPTTKRHSVGLFSAFIRSVKATYGLSVAVISFLANLIVGQVSVSDIGGPVKIAQMAGESARSGLYEFLLFLAALSINLAVLNLLPLPILDGGQFVLVTIEGIRKRALSAKVQAIVQHVCILLLLALMLFVTVKDIIDIL